MSACMVYPTFPFENITPEDSVINQLGLIQRLSVNMQLIIQQ